MKGFQIQQDYNGREKLTVFNYAVNNHLNTVITNSTTLAEGYVPVGSVEWVESVMGGYATPNYYPSFLKDHLYRNVWWTERLEEIAFYKPADRYKRFTGRILSSADYDDLIGYQELVGPYWASDIKFFRNEWRYYVSNGEVLCGWWYSGVDEGDGVAPKLDIKFPKTFCGAVDFGELSSGEFALVEVQHPYAIGWYGEDNDNYCKFLIEGWKSLNPVQWLKPLDLDSDHSEI